MALDGALEASYWDTKEDCIVCGGDDYAVGCHSARTLIFCDCCLDRGVHVECWHQREGELLTPERLAEPSFEWFCSEGCRAVSERLVALTGLQRPLEGEGLSGYSTELARWSPRDKGVQKSVAAAQKIFNSAFAPLIMDNGRNLIDMVCQAYESSAEPLQGGGGGNGSIGGGGGDENDKGGGGGPGGGGGGEEVEEDEQYSEESHNFSTFRVLLLRKQGQVVGAATLRVFGQRFCEVPFVATREGYRREGNCRRLMRALEGMLHEMGVPWVVLPAMRGVLPMWTRKFGYVPLSPGECGVLEERIVMPDPSSATLVRKAVQPAAAAAPAAGPAMGRRRGGAGAGAARMPAARPQRRVRFYLPSYDETAGDEDESDSGEETAAAAAAGKGRGGGKHRAAVRASSAGKDDSGGSDYELSDEDEGEEDDSDSGGGDVVDEGAEGVERECFHCGERGQGSRGWSLDPYTGELLCSSCAAAATAAMAEAEDIDADAEDDGGGSGAAVAAARTGQAPCSEGGKVCSNCGTANAARYQRVKESGLLHCSTCARYLRDHNGKPRPERLWKQQRKRPATAATQRRFQAKEGTALQQQKQQRQQQPAAVAAALARARTRANAAASLPLGGPGFDAIEACMPCSEVFGSREGMTCLWQQCNEGLVAEAGRLQLQQGVAEQLAELFVVLAAAGSPAVESPLLLPRGLDRVEAAPLAPASQQAGLMQCTAVAQQQQQPAPGQAAGTAQGGSSASYSGTGLSALACLPCSGSAGAAAECNAGAAAAGRQRRRAASGGLEAGQGLVQPQLQPPRNQQQHGTAAATAATSESDGWSQSLFGIFGGAAGSSRGSGGGMVAALLPLTSAPTTAQPEATAASPHSATAATAAALAGGDRDGRPGNNLAAVMSLALGSQESTSQVGARRQRGGGTSAGTPSAAGGAGGLPALPGPGAASSPPASAPPSFGSGGVMPATSPGSCGVLGADADVDAAMLAVEDIAGDLAG